MSLEPHLGHRCPHLVVEEPVELSELDRRTLPTKGPIASVDSVFLLANDQDYIPPSGLFTAATLAASRKGPFRIQDCAGGNTLVIHTQRTMDTVNLPTGDAVSIDRVLQAIRLATGNVLAVSENGTLILTENSDPGPESMLRVSGGAVSALGFEQLGSRGKEIYPPWQLDTYYDILPTELPVGLSPVPSRRIKFVRPVKGNPTLKATYAAMPDRCPRCGGTYVENDYRFDVQGDMVLLQDEDLLYQACLKALLTVLGSNPYHPSYGSEITRRIGLKANANAKSMISLDIQTALGKVKSLQQTQARYQNVTPQERLYSFGGISVESDPNDPTVFRAQVTVKNASNRPIQLNIVFTVPGVVALRGTNGLSLGRYVPV
jgi:hypothetical protein